jgi:hypothetical protein
MALVEGAVRTKDMTPTQPYPVVYCFDDLPVRLIWMTRQGVVTREMSVQADTTLKLIGPTEWISTLQGK